MTPILPRTLDNDYRGTSIALWLIGLVLFVKLGIAFGTIFNGRTAAQSADGIPLDALGAAGAQAVVALFAIWGIAQLAIGAIGVLALVRYRAMVPLMFLLLTLEHLARKASLAILPIATTGSHPGFYINAGLLATMVLGLALSLREGKARPEPRRA